MDLFGITDGKKCNEWMIVVFMSKEEIALEAWDLLKKGHTEKLPEEDIVKLYQYMIVLLGDDSLYEILKDSLPL